MMTLLMPYLKIIFKIICYLSIIPIIGFTIAIICLYFMKDMPERTIEEYKKEEHWYWWFDRGIWKE